MPVLRDLLFPTSGIPQQVVAPSRRTRMNQQQFYTQQLQQPQQSTQQFTQQFTQSPIQETQSTGPGQSRQQQFAQEPISGDYIQQQLAQYANRAAPPELMPSARVKSPNMELVEPSGFQQFYEQLASIDQRGQEMLGATKAKAAFKKMQELEAIRNQQVQGFGGATLKGGQGGGQAFGGVPSNPKANFRFAQEIGPNFGWGADELGAWYTLGMKESGWNNMAQNPTSTAFGIGQFLNSTWGGVGIPKTSDARTQVEAMARYIRNRYGSPSKALAFHLRNNWY